MQTCSRALATPPLRQERESCPWQAHLPLTWRERVVAPLELRRYRDQEIAAERVLGYDAAGRPCYTAYRFSLTEPRSDDGEEFYAVLAYGEALAAWRLADGRWLVWREIRAEESCHEARSFYSLVQEMPR